MDNSFILKLQEHSQKITLIDRIASRIIKLFNSANNLLKLKFKDDHLNRLLGLKYSKFDSIENMLAGNMINVEQAMNIYHLLNQTVLLNIPGDVVELGCYEGITSILMQKTLDELKSSKKIHVYDSFEGLPDTSLKDGNTFFKKGDCKGKEFNLIQNFKKFNAKLPAIHKGWFKDTLPKELPQKISFAHLDSDLYDSITISLEYIYPRLSKGAIVIIDDYCDPKILNVNNILPGVKKACDEFLKEKKEKINILIAGCQCHGYFSKL